MNPPALVLTLNVGSSSLKFAAYPLGEETKATASGTIEGVADRSTWLDRTLEQSGCGVDGKGLAAVGHRIVHGGPKFFRPCRVDAGVIRDLHSLVAFAPEHLPNEIALIEAVAKRFPKVPQVLCFDTAFHHDLPQVARLVPIPRRFEAEGIRRYGFHGLSYEFLRDELRRVEDPAIRQGRVILAHLGNGASLAALMDGACVDTTMGFTPAGGLVMGSRSGDLDPGVVTYLAEKEKWGPQRLSHLLNHESGLKGISETTSDMKELGEMELTDSRAAEAIAIFIRQAQKAIGGFTAILGGLDTLVFAGGIGEHDASIRSRICAAFRFIGLELDEAQNTRHQAVISGGASRVTVRVIKTDEEIVIARAVRTLLGH